MGVGQMAPTKPVTPVAARIFSEPGRQRSPSPEVGRLLTGAAPIQGSRSEAINVKSQRETINAVQDASGEGRYSGIFCCFENSSECSDGALPQLGQWGEREVTGMAWLVTQRNSRLDPRSTRTSGDGKESERVQRHSSEENDLGQGCLLGS